MRWRKLLMIIFGLIWSIVRRFGNRNYELEDLFQIGCIGFIKAVKRFDSDFETQLSTYAVPMILGEIRRYIRDNNQLRISRSIKDIAYKSLKIKEEYLAENNKEPDIEFIAKKLNVSINEVIIALESLKEPVSMFEPIYNDGGDTIYLYDQIEDKKNNNNEISNKIVLEEAINSLNQRERQILDERYIIGKTQMEIAEELNISQAQISRLEKRAIKQLKKTLR